MGFLNKKNGVNNEITILMEEISHLISESQSVNNDVLKCEKLLIKHIDDEFKKIVKTDDYQKYGVNNYMLAFYENIFGDNVKIICIISQGKTVECLNNFLKQNKNRVENSFNIDKKTLECKIILHVYYVADKMINMNNEDSIFHEVEHLYQYIMKKRNVKNYNPLLTDKTNYNSAIELMNSGDILEKNIGFVYYFSDYNEQDAMIQGLVGELKELKSFEIYNKYQDSNTRKYLKLYEKSISFIKRESDKNIDIICSRLGINKTKLLKIGEVGLNRFKKKIGKVLNYLTYNPLNEAKKTLFNEISEEMLKEINF